jgi:hypothetical protein
MLHLFHAILLHLLFLSTLAQKPRIDDGNYTISLLVRNGNFSGWLSMNASDAQPDAAIIGIDHREPGFNPTFVLKPSLSMSLHIANDSYS